MPRSLTILAAVSMAVIVVSGGVSYSSLMSRHVSRVQESSESQGREPADAIPNTALPVRVAALNGCGRPGIASEFVRKLRGNGVDVVNGMGGNADSFEFSRSVVVDRRDNPESAERVARMLGIKEILSQRSENPYLIEDVVIIIGRDWDTLIYPGKETPY